ncbi:eukaryotic translation initiation factor 4e transporter isoform x1 [Limosa lapponica baueri]|uniref:Eukaryotic translation initiation factor 4e transporter isoform x1 n=1 Tax=Limosa lapponica baueri TaxID=1758121 RepID=A0A2I0TI69_LIMLA|nr:eukaryotic translation initiation factor 4e transporter isoform x1 [Limosa lapponica baueri]
MSDGVWDPEKWHASLYPTSGRTSPVESFKKDLDSDRTSLMRRIVDPRERVKEDDLDVVLSPQRRSFGGGCHVTAAVSSRRAGSPLEKENDGVRVIGGRRIGSGRIISSRNFDKDHRGGDKDIRIECNGGVAEEDEVQTVIANETPADQEVPREAVLQEPAPGEFDFNEFFNLDKSVPGLASNSGNYFAPIPLEDHSENKVDILEMLQKAKVDLKPLLSSLSANKEKLRESSFGQGSQQLLGDPFPGVRKPMSPVAAQLSPSFTPTSVIRKMYESKEKSKEEPVSGKMKVGDGKDENQRPNEGSGAQGSPAGAQTTPQNVLSRTGLSHGHTQLDHRPSQRSGSPIGLAKWFGSDVLQQPLPSMPSKVISVDELEYRQ